MKKTVMAILAIIFLWGCKESEIIRYQQEKDGVYFVKRNINEISRYNFASSKKGDSLRTDTLKLYLRVLGWASDKARNVYFTTHSFNGLDSTAFDRFEFPNPFIFRANLLTDTMRVILHRPSERQTIYGMMLKIDTSNPEGGFAAGVIETSDYSFELKDQFNKPDNWDYYADYYGEYSIEKHAFMVTVLQRVDFVNDWAKGSQNIKLRAALEKYNKAHPDNPKPFTFPVNTSDW